MEIDKTEFATEIDDLIENIIHDNRNNIINQIKKLMDDQNEIYEKILHDLENERKVGDKKA